MTSMGLAPVRAMVVEDARNLQQDRVPMSDRQLETTQIFRRRLSGEATEKACRLFYVADRVVLRLLDEVTHRHVFDHVAA